MRTKRTPDRVEVVVGAGQVRLAVSYHLRAFGLPVRRPAGIQIMGTQA